MMFLYQLLLPLVFLAALPGWLLKTIRRGGPGSGLRERFGIYGGPPEFEPCGAAHIHAVSVGETILALKLIREWTAMHPGTRFVLAIGTPTGHAVAAAAGLENVRVTYLPFDFRWMMRRYLARFEPARIVLVEGEAWPNLLRLCQRKNIPVSLVNARMSPRSARRYRKFAPLLRPVFSKLALVATQEPGDEEIWKLLGASRIVLTGSLKFDPAETSHPAMRPEFSDILARFPQRKIALAASTHSGEEEFIARAIRAADPGLLPVIAPRHAERRAEVAAALAAAGFTPIFRSDFPSLGNVPNASVCSPVLIIDTTGELRYWTAYANLVIIGKSFLSTGGQNPAEAILARRPLILGPHMENFQPLAATLIKSGGALAAADPATLAATICRALDPATAETLTAAATACLTPHAGATKRIIDLVAE